MSKDVLGTGPDSDSCLGLLIDFASKLKNGAISPITAKRFLRDAFPVFAPVLRDGVIYFPVMSDGATGSEWIKRFEKGGFDVSGVKNVLRSSYFKPTKDVVTEIAIINKCTPLKGDDWGDHRRTSKAVRCEGYRRNLKTPNIETSFLLIFEMFCASKRLPITHPWFVIAMNDFRIIDPNNEPVLLCGFEDDNGMCHVGICSDMRDGEWQGDGGFAFEVSRVCT